MARNKNVADRKKIEDALVQGAIKAVSKYGLEGLTTNSIELEGNVHDAYIYRYYGGKEELLKAAFLQLDREFISEFKSAYENINSVATSGDDRSYTFWSYCWNCLIERPDVCKYYVRYYYSTYFHQYARDEHLALWDEFANELKDVFPIETDDMLALRHVLKTMLIYAMKVAIGEFENTKNNTSKIFKIIYSIINNHMNFNEIGEFNSKPINDLQIEEEIKNNIESDKTRIALTKKRAYL